jgi:hypothetical protein
MKTSMLIALIVVATSCGAVKDQGVQGTIQWIEGNQMPGPDKSNAPPAKGVSREVYIYPAISLSAYKPVDGFFNIELDPVAIVKSSDKGAFKVSLPPGKYSLLSKEEKGLFANQYDGDGCINCIEVRPREYEELTLKIDYNAVY